MTKYMVGSHCSFLESMVQKLGSSLFCERLCDVVHDYATDSLIAFVDYIRYMPFQKDTLIKLRWKHDLIILKYTWFDEPNCRLYCEVWTESKKLNN